MSIAQYRKWMFMYGVLTLLHVMKHFQEKEEYEECQRILDAINEQEKRLECKLPREINEDGIKQMVEVYKSFGLTGDYAVENSKHYSELIIKEIEDGNK